MTLGLLVVCWLGVGIGVWWLLAPAPHWAFRSRSEPETRHQLGHWVVTQVAEHLSRPVDHAARALEWPTMRILMIVTLLTATFLLVGLMVVGFWAVLALPLMVLGAWRYTGSLVLTQYRRWQRGMVSALPTLLAILQVHLDLGRTVPDALGRAVSGVRDPLRTELKRVLGDMHLATSRSGVEPGQTEYAREALFRLSDRVRSIEFRIFSDTIAQSWDSRLSGDQLLPMQMLLRITRERQAEETVNYLDTVMTSAPGFALFALSIWLMGGVLLSSLTGSGLF